MTVLFQLQMLTGSHPLDGVDSQNVEAFGHDGSRGFAQQHPPHVDFDHLTWRQTEKQAHHYSAQFIGKPAAQSQKLHLVSRREIKITGFPIRLKALRFTPTTDTNLNL